MSRDPPPHLPHPPSSSSQLQPDFLSSEQADNPGPDLDEEDIFRDMSFEEVLEDLNARFLINLPKQEIGLVRIYWQAEQAHWFYEDYLRPLNPLLPSLSQKHFTHLLIASSPLYSGDINYEQVWIDYCSYKRMVPCCGGILINKAGDKCLMVRGWKSNAGWCFPRGKINKDEPEVACAIREVEEETGFDLTGLINPSDNIQTQINAQTVTMFIVKDIDESTVFETQTRKEIGAIEWVKFTDLPTWTGKRGSKASAKGKKFYNVTPFVGPLKRWLTEHGINPNRPRHQAPPSSMRALEPYSFTSSSPPPPQSPSTSRASRPTSAQAQHHQTQIEMAKHASALDHLFAKFVHKQEEELFTTQVGKDNKAGLERLFGDLAGDQQSGGSGGIASHMLKEEEQTAEQRAKEEDDALARLLGGLSTSTPKIHESEVGKEGKRLLAVLNPKNPSRADLSETDIRPHQKTLLSMLSPKAAAGTARTANATKPVSLPASPRPASPGADERERRRKQRELLESIAGIGIEASLSPRSPPSTHQQDRATSSQSHHAFPPAHHGSQYPAQPPSPLYHQAAPSTYQHRLPAANSASRMPNIASTSTLSASPTKNPRPPPPPYDPAPQVSTQPYTPTAGPFVYGSARPPLGPHEGQGDHQRHLLAALYASSGMAPAAQPGLGQPQVIFQPHSAPHALPSRPPPGAANSAPHANTTQYRPTSQPQAYNPLPPHPPISYLPQGPPAPPSGSFPGFHPPPPHNSYSVHGLSGNPPPMNMAFQGGGLGAGRQLNPPFPGQSGGMPYGSSVGEGSGYSHFGYAQRTTPPKTASQVQGSLPGQGTGNTVGGGGVGMSNPYWQPQPRPPTGGGPTGLLGILNDGRSR